MFEDINNNENLISQNHSNRALSEDEISRIYEAAKEAEKAAKEAKKAAKKAKKAAKKAQKAAKKGNDDNCRNEVKSGNNGFFSKIKETIIKAIPKIISFAIMKVINTIFDSSTKKRGYAA